MNLDLQLLIGIGPDGKVRQDVRSTGRCAGYGIRSIPTTLTHVAPLVLSKPLTIYASLITFPMFYRHVALLGLCWFIRSIKLTNLIHCAPLERVR